MEMTAEQKLTKVMLKLRGIRHYYSAIYESLIKVPMGIDTIGVTTDRLLYCPEFIEKTEFEELMFINLHEIAHVALMHVARRNGRDPMLWNTACDLYVNQLLVTEFNLKLGVSTNINSSIAIKAPSDCIYCASVDIEKDCVEQIYNDLYEQASKNGYNKSSSRNSENSDEVFRFEYIGSKEKESWGERNSSYWSYRFSLTSKNNTDLVDDHADQAVKEQRSRKIVSEAAVKADMMQAGKNYGSEPGYIERYSRTLLKSHIDWKRLLRRYITTAKSKDSSFSNPDRRMYYQKTIYPGVSSEGENLIDGIKICIDTSGSISDNDLSRFFYQIKNLAYQFKVNAEIIYWDSVVQGIGKLDEPGKFKELKGFGGGGTNPSCVFEYFKANKIRPIVVLMLTDGIWGRDWINNVIKRKYGNTIWVLTKSYIDKFDTPFGRKAEIKWED